MIPTANRDALPYSLQRDKLNRAIDDLQTVHQNLYILVSTSIKKKSSPPKKYMERNKPKEQTKTKIE